MKLFNEVYKNTYSPKLNIKRTVAYALDLFFYFLTEEAVQLAITFFQYLTEVGLNQVIGAFDFSHSGLSFSVLNTVCFKKLFDDNGLRQLYLSKIRSSLNYIK